MTTLTATRSVETTATTTATPTKPIARVPGSRLLRKIHTVRPVVAARPPLTGANADR